MDKTAIWNAALSGRAKRRQRAQAATSSRGLVAMGVLWLFITAGALFFVLPIIVRQTADEAALKARGILTTAEALRVWSTPGGRGGPAYHLTFRLTLRGPSKPRVDEAYISADEAAALHVPSSIPIVYDPQRPEVAELNVRDVVHRRHPRLEGVGWIALLTTLVAAMWGAFGVFTREALHARRIQRAA